MSASLVIIYLMFGEIFDNSQANQFSVGVLSSNINSNNAHYLSFPQTFSLFQIDCPKDLLPIPVP